MELWPHRPRQNIIESLEWRTSVIRCKTAEYRHNVQPEGPRQTLAFQYSTMDEQEYGIAREKARKIGSNAAFVPEWQHLTTIPTISAGTVSIPVNAAHVLSYHVGGSLLIWESYTKCEVCTISVLGIGTITISATTQGYTNPTVAPLRVGTIAQHFEGKRPPKKYNEANITFEITSTEDMSTDTSAVHYPTYLGDYLVTSPREEINGLVDTTTREAETFDAKIGPIANYPLQSASRTAMSLALTAQTAQELINLRCFLATVCGRWKQFWLPSWNADFALTADLDYGADYIQIAAVGFVANYGIGTDVVVIDTAGNFYPLRVTSVTTEVAGSERLHFAGTVPVDLFASFVYKVCKLTLSRLDADRIELQYYPGLVATVAIPTQEVPL